MALGKRLREMRKRAGYTQKELALKIGAKHNSVCNWEKGLNKPNPETIELICKELGTTPNFLLMGDEFGGASVSSEGISTTELSFIKKYRGLDRSSRGAVDALLNYYFTIAEMRDNKITVLPESGARPMFAPEDAGGRAEPVLEIVHGLISTQSVAAGTGVFLDADAFESISLHKNDLTKKADFYVPVSGNSMEPKFHDGDILMVAKTPVKYGETGIFTLDGSGFVKVRGKSELISLNPDYKPIPMNDDIICNGKVIGVLDPEWLVD